MFSQDTIAALSTAPGTAALAVIRMSGPDAVAILSKIFDKDLRDAPGYTLHFGKIAEGENIMDEVVVGLFRSPHSYTGEDLVEISCHGSPYIQQQILDLLLRSGARGAEPGEFTKRAFLHGKMDLSQAEAVADLIASQSRASHDIAMQQMRGKYSTKLQELRSRLIEFGALIELELDFSEEDVEFADRARFRALSGAIQEELETLIHSFERGNVMRRGVHTVIAGRPNAGKSTLLNVLLQEERALVSEEAGTTRDTVEEELDIQGIRFRLIDTAGLREATNEIEKAGIGRTVEKIQAAALLIYVFDIHAISAEALQIDIESLRAGKSHVLLAGNKTDRGPLSPELEKVLQGEDVLFLSAAKGEGLHALMDAMYNSVVESGGSEPAVVVSNVRHLEALRHALAAVGEMQQAADQGSGGELIALEVRRALDALGSITGDSNTEDLLDYVFSKFCIGK